MPLRFIAFFSSFSIQRGGRVVSAERIARRSFSAGGKDPLDNAPAMQTAAAQWWKGLRGGGVFRSVSEVGFSNHFGFSLLLLSGETRITLTIIERVIQGLSKGYLRVMEAWLDDLSPGLRRTLGE